MGRGAWQAAVHGASKSPTCLSAGRGEEFPFFGVKWEPPESLEQEEGVM